MTERPNMMYTENRFRAAPLPHVRNIVRWGEIGAGRVGENYPKTCDYTPNEWDLECSWDDDSWWDDDHCDDECNDPDCDNPKCEERRKQILGDWGESDLKTINEEAYDEFRRQQRDNEQ